MLVGGEDPSQSHAHLSHGLGEIDLIFQLFVNDAVLDRPLCIMQMVRMKYRARINV